MSSENPAIDSAGRANISSQLPAMFVNREPLPLDERQRYYARLREALNAPPQGPLPITELFKLILDNQLNFAQHCFSVTFGSERDDISELAYRCVREFVVLITENPTAYHQAVERVYRAWKWYRTNSIKKRGENLDHLVKYCTDQLTADVLFRGLHRAMQAKEIVWEVLLRRTVEHILLRLDTIRQPILKGRPPQEEDILICIETVLGLVSGYKYYSLEQGIDVFEKWCRWALYREKKSTISPDGTLSISLDDPAIPIERLWYSRHTQLISRGMEAQIVGQVQLTRERQKPLYKIFLWLFGREDTIRYWVIAVLKEDYHLSWSGIGTAVIITDPCPMDPDDLPPSTQWHEVPVLFAPLLRGDGEDPEYILEKFYLDRSHILDRRWLSFRMLSSVFSKRDNAIKFYTLCLIKACYLTNEIYYPNPWKEISEITEDLVQNGQSHFISDDDLPPAITTEEVRRIFASGSRTEDALQRFYYRSLSTLASAEVVRHPYLK